MTELVRTYKLTDSGAWGWVTEEAEGGGGGGSLPSWWTVDSTPGSESVEFAGAVTIQAAIGKNPLDVIFPTGSARRIFFETEEGAAWRWTAVSGEIDFRFANVDGDPLLQVGPSGAVTISPSDAAVAAALKVAGPLDFQAFLYDDGVAEYASVGRFGLGVYGPLAGITVYDDYNASEPVFQVFAGTGAVTISPSGGAAPLTLVGLPTADPTVVGQLWNDTGTVKVSAG